jgi:hypothetical protein
MVVESDPEQIVAQIDAVMSRVKSAMGFCNSINGPIAIHLKLVVATDRSIYSKLQSPRRPFQTSCDLCIRS